MMIKINAPRILTAAGGLVVLAILVYALLPSAITVETAPVSLGALQTTIDEEGESRAHDRFTVAAPVAGRLARVQLHEGDAVRKGEVLASLYPVPLGAEERAALKERIAAAEARQKEAEARIERARALFQQAKSEKERTEGLAKKNLASAQALETAVNAEAAAGKDLEAARFESQAAAAEVQIARSGLLALEEGGNGSRVIRMTSPVKGKILRVLEKSERVVSAGTPIVTVGDPSRMEIVVDVLSSDAVKIAPGMPVILEKWGGEAPIAARVRTVEPAAFTKISALGIEEKRVNVIADFADSPGPLGDGFRVEAKIVIWQADSVLKVTSSALFRTGESWSVFTVEGGRARIKQVEPGHRGSFETEILKGLKAGQTVIPHPSNELRDGARVKAR